MRKFISIFVYITFVLSYNGWAQFNFTLKGSTDLELNNCKVIITANSRTYHIQRDSTRVLHSQFVFQGKMKMQSNIVLLRFINNKGHNRWYTFVLDSGTTTLQLLINKSNRIINTHPKSESNHIHEIVESIPAEENLKHRIVRDEKEEFTPLSSHEELALNKRIIDTLASYPNNYYSLLRLVDISRYVKMVDQEDILLAGFNKLSDKLRSTPIAVQFVKELKSRISAKMNARVGSNIPEFTVPTEDGPVFNNYSLSGSRYLIVFSATWCIPCQSQLPELLKLYKTFEPQGLKIVYFNLDDDKNKWFEHIKKNRLEWINVSEGTKFSNSPIAKQLHITHVPTYILVDQKGKITLNSDTADISIKELHEYLSDVLKTTR
jgi:thiol-disulfide isomerase/thioredoxin